jgi:hypothetical protein
VAKKGKGHRMNHHLTARLELAFSLLQLAILSKRKVHTPFVDEIKTAAPIREVPKKIAQEPPQPPPLPPPVVEPKKDQPPSIASTFIPFLHTLSERPKIAEARSLENYKKLFEEQGVSLVQNRRFTAEKNGWQQEIPHVIIISAFAKGSSKEAFLQNVASALRTRLGKRVFCSSCSQEAAGAIVAFASTDQVGAIIAASDFQTKEELLRWIGTLPTKSAESSKKPLESAFELFKAPIYELLIPQDGEQTASFKRELWKALQSL